MKNLPDWLKQILDDSGLEQGKYVFGEGEVTISGLPEGFVGIAESEEGGLAISDKNEGVIYRWENGEMGVFAVNETEFKLAIRRDEVWEELSENMPVTKPVGLGIILTTKTETGERLTVGFKGSSRNSAMIIQGQMEAGEMLEDALKRELIDALEVEDYQVVDLVDDGGEMVGEAETLPMFVTVVEVEGFDPARLDDQRIGWINLNKTELAN